jgi:hypothetical protein
MPSGEEGYVYAVVKEKQEFSALLVEQFPEGYLSFIENPQDPNQFGSDKIPGSIGFPGFIFDSTKEMRWYINDGKFHVTVISDEFIPGLPEVEGKWTREEIGAYIEEDRKSNERGVCLVKPRFLHIDVRSETLKEYLKGTEGLQYAESFSRDVIPIFLTLRRLKQ